MKYTIKAMKYNETHNQNEIQQQDEIHNQNEIGQQKYKIHQPHDDKVHNQDDDTFH